MSQHFRLAWVWDRRPSAPQKNQHDKALPLWRGHYCFLRRKKDALHVVSRDATATKTQLQPISGAYICRRKCSRHEPKTRFLRLHSLPNIA